MYKCSLTGRDIFTVTVSCGDIGNISEVVGWITEGGAENGKMLINTQPCCHFLFICPLICLYMYIYVYLNVQFK